MAPAQLTTATHRPIRGKPGFASVAPLPCPTTELRLCQDDRHLCPELRPRGHGLAPGARRPRLSRPSPAHHLKGGAATGTKSGEQDTPGKPSTSRAPRRPSASARVDDAYSKARTSGRVVWFRQPRMRTGHQDPRSGRDDQVFACSDGTLSYVGNLMLAHLCRVVPDGTAPINSHSSPLANRSTGSQVLPTDVAASTSRNMIKAVRRSGGNHDPHAFRDGHGPSTVGVIRRRAVNGRSRAV